MRGRPPLVPLDADLNHIPDAAMTAAVLALFARRPVARCATSASWRVKETDRLAAMATELRKLGATVEEGADFLRITPPAAFRAAARRRARAASPIDTYDDHRMAMCFALAVLRPACRCASTTRGACRRRFPTSSTPGRAGALTDRRRPHGPES